MRVLLVEPPKTPWLMMGEVVALPLGLAQLAGCLEKAGIPVEILDANALELDQLALEEAIARREPDLVGMTAFTPWVPDVHRAVRAARKGAPRAVIALGGPHVTFTAEETLSTMPEVDLVARGEGDQIIVDLARAVEAGTGLEDVPGITPVHALVGQSTDIQSNDVFPVIHRVTETGCCGTWREVYRLWEHLQCEPSSSGWMNSTTSCSPSSPRYSLLSSRYAMRTCCPSRSGPTSAC